MNKTTIKTLIGLHGMLMVYSMSGICSKLAAGESFLSARFCIYYAVIIVLLGGICDWMAAGDKAYSFNNSVC